MNPKINVEPLRLKTDARGSVCEPLSEPQLATMKNVHVVINEPGCVRGNHAHLSATEIAIIYGPARVKARCQGQLEEHIVPADQAWRFTFPPTVSHAFQNTGMLPGLIVAFSTEVHDPANPKLIPDILIKP
jgi:dTDP-4-dehydrorhamnose 3,5-epimerase-like enzyme